MELVLVLRTLHRELDHVQAFDWVITALYDFVGRGGRIELSLSVDGSHVHQGRWSLPASGKFMLVFIIETDLNYLLLCCTILWCGGRYR
jgi:hypothetical protein